MQEPLGVVGVVVAETVPERFDGFAVDGDLEADRWVAVAGRGECLGRC